MAVSTQTTMGRCTARFEQVHRAAERAYVRMPHWMQTVLCNLEGARIQRRRYPARFRNELEEGIARMELPRIVMEQERLMRLREMLTHAGRHVPYWRDLFSRLRFSPEQLRTVEDLRALPVLTKDIVTAQGARMLAEHVPAHVSAGGSVRLHTSGSTGAGLSFVASESAQARWWAACWRFRSWHGIRRGTWSAQLTGRVVVPVGQRSGPLFRVNYLGRQLLLSGYHLSAQTADVYLREIARRRLPWIHGYPSLVVVLADAAAASGISLPHLRWVTLASENVTPWIRERVRAGFGLEPRENYAQTEAVANASEGPDGVLRIDDDFSVVELESADELDDGCRIFGTSLDNWHQPFIRYDTGDIARPMPEGDSGGWRPPGRALRGIDGRREDYVELRSGALVGRTDHIFKRLSFVREAQIRQAVPGKVEIRVVARDGAWTPDRERALRGEAAARLGDDTIIEIVPTHAIERAANGKLRLVVRERPGGPAA